jgi:hypothetical protein
MEQAKAHNPDIKVLGMPWGAPGWIGGGNFYSQDMIDYYLSWLDCAKQHGVTVDYGGGWNEKDFNATCFVNLKAALKANGYSSVKRVGGDNWGDHAWTVATDMKNNSALYDAVDIAGGHYTCGGISAMTTCSSTSDAHLKPRP